MHSPNLPYIERLDHLRLFAAALVVLFHAELLSGRRGIGVSIPMISEGHIGVPLFMVISGYILTRIAQDRDMSVGLFYVNRLLRIYPLFATIILFSYCAVELPGGPQIGFNIIAALLPISNLFRENYGQFGGHLWSIAVELQFYAIFPLIIARWSKGEWKVVCASIIGAALLLRLAAYTANGTVHFLSYFTIFGNIDCFVAGMALARIESVKDKWNTIERLPPVTVLFAAIVIVNLVIFAAFTTSSFYQISASGSPSASMLWIVWPTIQAAIWLSFIFIYLHLNQRYVLPSVVSKWGQWSYSIYGWHVVVIVAATKIAPPSTPKELFGMAVLVATLCTAGISFHVIERPFLSLRYRYVSR